MDASIIIPTFNRIWSLKKAIQSCSDTNLNIEIIVIDDGSTDDTWDWLKQQTNIIPLHQQNAGKDWAVNKAFSICRGKYVRFLDSDDWVLPYSTDALFAKAEKEKLDVVCAGYLEASEEGEIRREVEWVDCDDFIAQQLGECNSSHYSAYLFRRAFIADIPHRQEYGARDDRQFIIEVALKRPRFGYISTPTLAHRIHSRERLQRASGIVETFYNYATLNIYKRAFSVLKQQDGEVKSRYIKASLNVLWPLCLWISKTHLADAKELYRWMRELDSGFRIAEEGIVGLLYKYLGFDATQKILKIRRLLKYGVQ